MKFYAKIFAFTLLWAPASAFALPRDCDLKAWAQLGQIEAAALLGNPEDVLKFWSQRFPLEKQAQPAATSQVVQANEEVVRGFARSENGSVRFTGEHLMEITDAVLANPQTRTRLENLGLDVTAFRLGAYSSDKGKGAPYMRFLTVRPGDPDATAAVLKESDRILDILRNEAKPTKFSADGKIIELGTEKSAAALSELLTEIGLNPSYFNPQATNAQIREVLNRVPSAQGFFHELPGLRDLTYLYELGYISKDTFKNSIRHDLGHNGPQAGFWKILSHEIVAKQATDKEAADQLAHIMTNGVFEGRFVTMADGSRRYQLHYPDISLARYSETVALQKLAAARSPMERQQLLGLDVGPVAHQISDRLSVAARNGFFKISHELNILNAANPVATAQSLLVANPQQTLEQLRLIEKLVRNKLETRIGTITRARARGDLPAAEAEALLKLVEAQATAIQQLNRRALQYVQAYKGFVARNFRFNADNTALTVRFADGSEKTFGKSDVRQMLEAVEARMNQADASREIGSLDSYVKALADY